MDRLQFEVVKVQQWGQRVEPRAGMLVGNNGGSWELAAAQILYAEMGIYLGEQLVLVARTSASSEP